MSSDLLSFAGWYFLPNLVTGWVQTAFYAIWIRAGDPKPAPGSRQWVNHRRSIHATVVFAYLIYTIYEADWQIRRASDFYQDLGVSLNVDDKGILSRFRRLTVLYHPDKATSSQGRSIAEGHFVHLKVCRDTLVDPVKRFAYDRFGPEVLQWRHRLTVRDYVSTGLQRITAYYVGTGAVLALLGVVGYLQQAPFWRYWAIGSLYLFELYTLTRPASPMILDKVINPLVTTFGHHPPYLQFQALILARRLMLSFFIALSQIGPLLFPASPGGDGGEVSRQQLDRLGILSATVNQESARLLELEMAPFTSDPASMQHLRGSMRSWLVDNTVRANATVRTAVGKVMERRRAGAPSGAR